MADRELQTYNAALTPQECRRLDKRFGIQLRAKSRTWLTNNFDTLMDMTMEIVKTGGKEDGPRVTLLCKVWDKLLPNQNEGADNGSGAGKTVFNFANIQRGPQGQAQVVEVTRAEVAPQALEAEGDDEA